MNYPTTVEEVIKERKYKPEVLQAVKEYKRSRPWRGDFDERWMKLVTLHTSLNEIYNKNTRLRFIKGSHSSYYNPGNRRITIVGEISVVTYLHEYAHSLFGASEKTACEWSINLFRRVFPLSFRNTEHQGHMLRRKRNV
jgi:hypothetical protein